MEEAGLLYTAFRSNSTTWPIGSINFTDPARVPVRQTAVTPSLESQEVLNVLLNFGLSTTNKIQVLRRLLELYADRIEDQICSGYRNTSTFCET